MKFDTVMENCTGKKKWKKICDKEGLQVGGTEQVDEDSGDEQNTRAAASSSKVCYL